MATPIEKCQWVSDFSRTWSLGGGRQIRAGHQATSDKRSEVVPAITQERRIGVHLKTAGTFNRHVATPGSLLECIRTKLFYIATIPRDHDAVT